jgi:hypothetical protein
MKSLFAVGAFLLTLGPVYAQPVQNNNDAWEQFADRLMMQINGKADWGNCLPSAPMRQIEGLSGGRISGSS